MTQEESSEDDVLEPRDYQIKLMEIALRSNTIVYLPTGTGKTYIAVMVLRQLSAPLERTIQEGGKISVLLVNTVALVDQQAEYIRRNTHFKVGAYTGDLNVDLWEQAFWLKQINSHQVFVMTTQIFVNLLEQSTLNLNHVNLLIFDECHRAVNDQPMRQVMLKFQNLETPPRVVGLTATLLNGNCAIHKVIDEVRALETTFHSKVASIDELEDIIGFSTNPTEIFKIFNVHQRTFIETTAIDLLNNTLAILKQIKLGKVFQSTPKPNLQRLYLKNDLSDIINFVNDVILHINMFGVYGGKLALITHMIQLERMKKSCQDSKLFTILEMIMTSYILVSKMFENEMKCFDEKLQIYRFSSHQIQVLFNILRDYRNKSKQPLCGIIFVQRRSTAKILYNVLLKLSQVDSEFDYIQPNFIIGLNTNPYNDTRENLFKTKMNRKVMHQFINKEINLLVASNILEEGVDIPLCTLVVKFDELTDYRSYIQSKGRARHRHSFYYMMVNTENSNKFEKKYVGYQQIENQLNEYLLGQNEVRSGPSEMDIQELYNEHEILPYYVDGPESAQINLNSAISLLYRYCLCLPSDKYTVYTPNWYLDKDIRFKMVIELPTVCPILEPIEGPIMKTKKLAKKATAMEVCKILHKIGELNDLLLPKRYTEIDEDCSIYFEHWPPIKERGIGNKNKTRVYEKHVPDVFKGQIRPQETVYLHVIELQPLFTPDTETNRMIYEIYTSPLCFGLISSKPLPKLCNFSVYVSLGEITVNFKVNEKAIDLTEKQIYDLRNFHCLIFGDILKVLKLFMVFDNDENTDALIVTPIQKINNEYKIDFDTVYNNTELIEQKQEPNNQEKLEMDVTDESHLKKIVTPWYRNDDKQYLVTCICRNLNAHSSFPSEDYRSYVHYFNDKYQTSIQNPTLPLLLVKGLSKKLNYTRPHVAVKKRTKENSYEEMEEHLLPELCVKQNFPAELWLQALLLPSILHRIHTLTLADELRRTIAQETGLGVVNLPINEHWADLQFDPNLLNYDVDESKTKSKTKRVVEDEMDSSSIIPPQIAIQQLSQDFTLKKLEAEYPWEEKSEPVDIERNLHVTLMEIQYYENFINEKVPRDERILKNEVANKRELPAITFNKEFVETPIILLTSTNINNRGPELSEIFKALTSARSNDIVNLERLETLGDSFLKLSISLFIYVKHPKYNEGKATVLKGRLISNKNLYYIGVNKKLGGYMKNVQFHPSYEWKPPYFCVPKVLANKINSKKFPATKLFDFPLSKEEQINGILEEQRQIQIMQLKSSEENEEDTNDQEEMDSYDSMYTFLQLQIVPDKTIADCVEALLGSYFSSCGFKGGLIFLEWLGIIPKTENIFDLLSFPIPNPILSNTVGIENIDFHLPSWKNIEERLGYHFKNRAYLLQALTHSTYTPNRITNCYQTLEFLGDAILDFLITCHIYETCQTLNPGQLTDLRSALVNNTTFAGFAVRCGFHKFLLYSNTKLSEHINNFVEFQKTRNFVINEEILILLEEDDMHLAEHVDVPKVLGDVFEALAGAVFLDSGMSLETVWSVFYKIMWNEIELFRNNVPKNAVRLLYETVGAHPEFQSPKELDDGKTMVRLDFMLNGEKKMVYGFGNNKVFAKKAAAKIALRLLYK